MFRSPNTPVGRHALVWKSGTVFHFDGAKDLFKYAVSPRWKRRDAAKIAKVGVTAYTKGERVDAFRAAVLGSDVYGPMGRRRCRTRPAHDAEVMKDHAGHAASWPASPPRR